MSKINSKVFNKEPGKCDPFSRQKTINKCQLRNDLEVGIIKGFRTAFITVLQEVKENILETNDKRESISREIENK